MIAHGGGGIPYALLIFLMWMVIVPGFWLLTRQRRPADGEPPGDSPAIGAGEDEPASISEHRREGATRLHSLMGAQRASEAGADGSPDRRKEPESS